MRIYAFKRKKLRGNVVFTTTGNLYLFRFTYAYMQITVHSSISLETKISILKFPNACVLGQPFYFDYQDFNS